MQSNCHNLRGKSQGEKKIHFETKGQGNKT